MEKGTRVGALMSADETSVKFFGWGTYEGHEVPGPEAGGMGPLVRTMNRTNPKIVLDSGKVVWGCECWFGPEDKVREMLGDRKIEEMDIEAVRAEVAAAAAETQPEEAAPTKA